MTMSEPPPQGTTALQDVSILPHIFTPGSSLNPTFLLIVDGVFVALLLVLFVLAFATSNVHFVVLIFIAFGLWASVKWFVNELQLPQITESDASESKKDK